MQSIALLVFFGACLYAVVRPSLAFALAVYVFPIKQILQLYVPWMLGLGFNSQIPNYSVSLAVGGAFLWLFVRRRIQGAAGLSQAALVIALFAWSVASLLWTPTVVREDATAVMVGNWPYLVLFLIFTPLLVQDFDSLYRCIRDVFIVGVFLSGVILTSRDFQTWAGTLSYNLGGVRSNYLAIGEVGGLTIISGLLLRSRLLGGVGAIVQLAAVFIGVAVAFRSGARGQLVMAVVAAVATYPIARSIRSPFAFIGGAVVIGVVLWGTLLLISALADDATTAKRWSIQEILYGASSAEGRFSGVADLAITWLESPIHWIEGLGIYSYRSIRGERYAIYSHNVPADMLFELGLIGFGIFVLIYRNAAGAAWGIWRGLGSSIHDRASFGALLGIALYQLLLSTKQGMLWISVSMFMYCVILSRLWHIKSRQQPDGPSHLQVEGNNIGPLDRERGSIGGWC
jgi:hypothetical protein